LPLLLQGAHRKVDLSASVVNGFIRDDCSRRIKCAFDWRAIFGIEGANAIVVVYQGSPRGFLTCTGSESMTGPTVLDARGRFVQDGDTVKIRTQYIATMGGAAGSEAIEFSDTTSATFSSGVTCQASGTFPGTVAGALVDQRWF
jgi:hypothetical protein